MTIIAKQAKPNSEYVTNTFRTVWYRKIGNVVNVVIDAEIIKTIPTTPMTTIFYDLPKSPDDVVFVIGKFIGPVISDNRYNYRLVLVNTEIKSLYEPILSGVHIYGTFTYISES